MEALGAFGRRMLAWLIIVIAVLLVLKIAAGVVIGFAHFVLTVVILVAIGAAVLWALRHL